MATEVDNTCPKRRYRRSDDVNKPRIHIKCDMNRLERNLKAIHLVRPEQKEYHPRVFNSLQPYRDVHVTKFLVNLPEVNSKSYHVRQLAINLCDPWVDLEMDRTFLPRVPSTGHLVSQDVLNPQKKPTPPGRPPKEGSTMLPKFPVVAVPPDDLLKEGDMVYSDVPSLRRELAKFKAGVDEDKFKADYIRTVQDFYRMELDRFDQMKPGNRNRIHLTYDAYLHNTPGSKLAIQDCTALTRQRFAQQIEQGRHKPVSNR